MADRSDCHPIPVDPNAVLIMGLDKFEFPERIRVTLWANDVITLGQLVRKSRKQLLSIHRFGIRSVLETEDFLATRLGLRLAMSDRDIATWSAERLRFFSDDPPEPEPISRMDMMVGIIAHAEIVAGRLSGDPFHLAKALLYRIDKHMADMTEYEP